MSRLHQAFSISMYTCFVKVIRSEAEKLGSPCFIMPSICSVLLGSTTFAPFIDEGRVVPPEDFFLFPPIVDMIIITTTMPIPIITETGSVSPL